MEEKINVLVLCISLVFFSWLLVKVTDNNYNERNRMEWSERR